MDFRCSTLRFYENFWNGSPDGAGGHPGPNLVIGANGHYHRARAGFEIRFRVSRV